jgi:hypothetical protein
LRHLAKTPIFIPLNAITEIKFGSWHSGRWAFGKLIAKFIWKKGDLVLSSGFILADSRKETKYIKQILDIKLSTYC